MTNAIKAPPTETSSPAGDGLQLLLIEDNPVDATMVKAMLSETMGTKFTCTSVGTLSEGLVALAASPVACVLLDLDLLDSEGLGTLDAVLAAGPGPAVVVLTGLDDDRAGRAAVAAGAQDYLVKGKVDAELLCRATRYAVERKQIQLNLARERQVLELIARDMPPESILEHLTVAIESEIRGAKSEIVLVIRTDGRVALDRIVAPSLSTRYLEGLDKLARSGVPTPQRTVASQHAAVVALDTGGTGNDDSGGFGSWPQWQQLARAEGVVAVWMVPVMSEGNALGTLALYPPEPRHPTAAELDVLGASANLVALAVERYESKRALTDQALHDELTRLPNRFLLADRLEQALREGVRHKTETAVLFLDLDKFKLLNDGQGHAFGDLVLREAARRLAATIRVGDTLARFGGDEFVVICPGQRDARYATLVGRRLLQALAQPFVLEGSRRWLSASIGLAMSGDEHGAEELLRDADAAMYRTKELGGNRLEIFDERMREIVLARLEAEAGLRQGIESHELVVHYQPQVQLASGRTVGVEALVRWARPEQGLLLPSKFIPMAEESGLIAKVGSWVLHQACADAALWAKNGRPLGISVNVSGRQLAERTMVEDVASALLETGLDASLLCLEVTETALMQEADNLADTINGLADLGVRLSIDDFGTGYASLAYLNRIKVNELKVDICFVKGLGLRAEDEAIVAAVVGLGRALGLDVVAEGVETDLQVARLLDLGCHIAQGYLFGAPVPLCDLPTVPAPPTCTWVG